MPADNKGAIESTRLPDEFHQDPADRMIVALARTLSAPLITADEKILNYPHVRTIF
ncbi:PIN domain-containing protein [Alteromonas sp. P256]|uniref:PIN domain-containing protein n=1 Tax=Alteromonas sp. P256 TaxID=3117399 RepID=UPI003F68B333